MTSASTKRQKHRDAALLAKWTGTAIGTRVTVHRANGRTIKTITLCEPFALHAGAYVRVQGIDGKTHLRRLTPGWEPTGRPEYADDRLPWNAKAEKEIQRLRAAMVHAMDDAEWGAKTAGAPSRERFAGIARRLRAALEKK
jgi:hypothetical protein